MFNRYFQQELANLKELGEDFSKAHPAVAPMLRGPTVDPDAERLLEGVAFLTALLRQKLDDEFPEIVHELVRLIWPHYLRPIPSASIVTFRPKPTLKETMTIPAGIHIASIPVEGTSCIFQTCYSVDIHSLDLSGAALVEPAGRPAAIKLKLTLMDIKLADWQPQKLRFFLAGDYSVAADIYLLLTRYLKQIIISVPDSKQPLLLTPDHLRPVGFSNNQSLIPYPGNSFPGYRILQEYFFLPEKFLFLDLVGWEHWLNRGEGNRFEVTFELEDLPFSPPRVKADNFVLSATPVINVFPHDADPIRLDHRKTEYLVRPTGGKPSHYQVYSLEKVVGFIQGTAQERVYVPFEVFNPELESNPVYQVNLRGSPVHAGFDVYLSVAYPQKAGSPAPETLSIQLQCTNGFLPERIQLGDISLPTSSTPEFVDFKNIRTPTPNVLPPLGSNLLWRLLSHLSLNYVMLAKAEDLRALLDLYVFEAGRDRSAILANKKRIAGIEQVETGASNRLASGVMMRGREIRINMRQDHFASQGDMFLFGCVLDHFLGSYASMNSYTRLSIKEVIKGELYQWPVRIGDQPLV
ncbi:MAG: type VI secretion system baseplate subunit TssF [Deltaproteobacteria bacterium]|nr:MAG: type VI secretion system baseplate subunit TssF [Deltaproteobacteria bacterium]